MSAIGDIGYGATIAVDDGVSSAFAVFVGATQITVPIQEAAFVETTHLTSPSRTREYVPSLIEPGECSFTQRYTATAYSRAVGLKSVNHNFKITFPDGGEATFEGFVTKAECDIGAADQVVDIKVTIRVTGAVSFDPNP